MKGDLVVKPLLLGLQTYFRVVCFVRTSVRMSSPVSDRARLSGSISPRSLHCLESCVRVADRHRIRPT